MRARERGAGYAACGRGEVLKVAQHAVRGNKFGGACRLGLDEIMLLEIMLFFMEFFFPGQNFFHFCRYLFPKLPSFVYVQL